MNAAFNLTDEEFLNHMRHKFPRLQGDLLELLMRFQAAIDKPSGRSVFTTAIDRCVECGTACSQD